MPQLNAKLSPKSKPTSSSTTAKSNALFSWTSIFRAMRRHRTALYRGHLIALAAALVSVPTPLFMPLLVDEVLLEQPARAVTLMNGLLPQVWQNPYGYILLVLVLVIALRLLSLILGVWQVRQFTLIAKSICFGIREQLLAHLPRVSLQEYESQGSAALSARCVTDVDTLDKFISETIARFLVALLTIVGTAIILLLIDWQLGLIILLLNPAVIYLSRSFGKHVKSLKGQENAAVEAFQLALAETLDNIQQLRVAHREHDYFQRVLHSARELKNFSAQAQWRIDAVSRFSFTIFLLGFEVFRAIAMLMVVFSDLSVGQIFAVFGYLWFMMGPVQEILNIQYSYFAANAALERLNQVLQLKCEPHYAAQFNPFEEGKLSLRLENVCFHYHSERPVLENINMHIPDKARVAIVAVSGGGKSTLVNVLLGLYPHTQGQIYFNQHPIEQVGYAHIRQNAAVVLQQPMLFNSSIRENLNLGRQHDDAQLWQALRLAELADSVSALPEQLDTLVGRNGVRLSGGQKQRLAIARMLLSDPKLVILDEATSALDTQTEARIHHNLREFLAQRTTIIIAHRLSAIRQADLIYVLDEGRISQMGAHDELIDSPGLYQRFYRH